jgi:Tol biopolymer transport system component
VYAFTRELDEWWESRRNILTESPEGESPSQPMAVEAVASEPEVAEPEPSAQRPRISRLSIFAIAGLILTAGLAGWILRAGLERGNIRVTQVTNYPGDEETPALSPDGRQAAFSWNGVDGKNYDIYVTRLDRGGVKRITTSPEWDFSPAWSPHADQIAFLRVDGNSSVDILIVGPDGGAERKVAEVKSIGGSLQVKRRGLTWTPDGQWLIVCGSDSEDAEGLLLVPIHGGPLRRLTLPPKGQYDLEPALAPGGKLLAFRREKGFSVSELYSLELSDDYGPAAPEKEMQVQREVRVGSPQWERDDSLLYIAKGSIMRVLTDAHGVARAQPVALVSHPAGCGLTALSYQPSRANGVLASCTTDETSIWRLDLPDSAAQPGRLTRITASRSDLGVALSPDGRQIAFESERDSTNNIWIANVDGSSARKITDSRGVTTGSPAWSPDGKSIAFDSNREGRPNVYVLQLAGGAPRRLTHSLGEANLPQWSHDGKWIYFAGRFGARFEVARMPASGGEVTQITRNGGTASKEWPDGRGIYYVRREKEAWSLRQCLLDGSDDRELVPSMAYRAFAIADNGVYFISMPGPDGRSSIEFLNFANHATTLITPIQKPQWRPMALSPDQRFLLFSQFDHWGRDLMVIGIPQ